MENTMTTETTDNYPKIDLIELLRGLWRSCRHLLLEGIVLVVAAAALLGFMTFRSYTPRYQASASFTVRVGNPFYASQQYYNSSVAEQMAKTFPYILTSGVLSQEVKEALGISYMPSVSASAMGNTNIFTLTVTSGDPQLAYDVLNCVIEIYPSVAEFVVGPTQMSLLSESGVPKNPVNSIGMTGSVVKGAALGFILWMGICALYAMTHRTVNNEEELRQLINLSCLGKLPTVRGRRRGRGLSACPIINESNDKFGFNESVRLLRVRVEREMAKADDKVLLVTSTIANEGKTTISVNLATALAQKGKRVLLIDCDLRNPSVAGIFDHTGEEGLADFLKGEKSLKDVVRRIDSSNLCVIFGGKPVSNPEKLLARKTARELIRAARNSFDYIILDTPPCALMADAGEIGTLADCALLTVRQDFACRGQILEGVNSLNDNGRPIIGCVMNMTAPKINRSGYSYYGYYK
ncbi:MAG: polysaccharide biosynthesis tyrosine autokinase [Lachnospiraceae bacterium]|nr:polysaccharide biosynthesis tyrosine autokinase [Lachnospiraceae bacterium]